LPPPDLELCLLTPSGIRTVPLPRRGEVAIGRGADCELRVEDEKVSRRHAVVRVAEDPNTDVRRPDRREGADANTDVDLIDLGGRNGTMVNGRRLSANEVVRLKVGDVVALGSSVMTLRRAVPVAVRVWSASEYEARFEREKARAAATSGVFAVLILRIQPLTRDRSEEATTLDSTRGELIGAEVDAAFRRVLRPQDVVAPHDAWSYRVLLAGADAQTARALGERLSTVLATSGVRARVGVADHPTHGASLAELEAAADAELRDVGYRPAAQPAPSGRAMREIESVVARIAPGTINVIVTGETGVGKEVMASAIHARSPRAAGPFLGINCAALSESLFESELFGHERGAFTGAQRAKPGLLEAAEGGTLFLDEVTEMPLPSQAKLLRVLEDRQVLRVGALRPKPIDVRIITATNKELEVEIAAHRFRSDLYFRLNGICIRIPPLRDRLDEIESLAAQLLEAASPSGPPPPLGPDVLQALRAHPWPGNVRELRNVLERALLLSGGGPIRREHLGLAGPPSTPRGRTDGKADGSGPPLDAGEEEERSRIIDALDRCVWNQTYAAELLGISRRTLVNRLQKYGIARPRTRPPGLT
jgi:DNA-binding NtrC family response regulator